ncbi:tyrosine-type recombinase/integrase [Streptomyces sp. RPT161]|uniref:tyrosine-type recombinase/integrase n=1 Tax=Streptomyces sp. RPT161 TaxID=3015993 RepID=UPI0022B8F9A4|nr:tyrosine-type recombinase/integrase [Streptomyces sp. RPT161]
MTLLPAPRPVVEPATVPAASLRGTPPASTPTALVELLRTAGAAPTVIEATGTWLMARESEHSRTAYAKDASWWLSWCAATGTDPAAARAIHADQYGAALREAKLAKSTRGRRLAVASSWYAYLVRAEVAERNPFAGMDRPSADVDSSPTRGLTAEQLGALLAHARAHESPRTYALLAVLATTAGRIGSILAVTVGAMGQDQGHRVLDLVVKGNKTKRVVLVPLAVEALETYLGTRGEVAPDAYLFATSNGRPMDEPAALRTLRRVANAAGIPHADQLSPHSLRHSYATALLDKGVPLADVQDALGHADPRTTRRYDRARGALHRSPSYRLAESLTQAMNTTG